jgi:hypothetical protein
VPVSLLFGDQQPRKSPIEVLRIMTACRDLLAKADSPPVPRGKSRIAVIDLTAATFPNPNATDRLLIVSDAAALIADASLEGLLESRLPRFRKIVLHRRHASFRRALYCVEGPLAYWVVTELKGANVHAEHAGTWKRREFAVRRIEAGNIKVAVVKLLVIRIAECAQRRNLVALERDDSAVEHRFRFVSGPELVGTSQGSGRYQR